MSSINENSSCCILYCISAPIEYCCQPLRSLIERVASYASGIIFEMREWCLDTYVEILYLLDAPRAIMEQAAASGEPRSPAINFMPPFSEFLRNYYYREPSFDQLDPRINQEHFNFTFTIDTALPVPPEVNLDTLPDLFQRLVSQDHPDISDPDTPANYEDLMRGITALKDEIIREEHFIFYSPRVRERLPLYLRHIVHLLQSEAISNNIKATCLVELAKAKHRECPTRIMNALRMCYETLKGEIQIVDLKEKIHKILHDMRLGILANMSTGRENVHEYSEYQCALGPYIGLIDYQSADQEHPNLVRNLAPQHTLPKFLERYTSEKIIERITLAINGLPIAGRPAHERTAKEVSTELLSDWLGENIPADFEPSLSHLERKEAYELHVFERETNTLKPEALEYFLKMIGILN